MISSIQEFVYISMGKCISVFQNNLSNIRANNISPALLKNIYIEYYGVKTSLFQLSNIVTEDNKTLKLTLFDLSIKSKVEKAIIDSNLGFNPISTDSTIRISIPILSEERRKNLIKIIRKDSEYTKVAVRNIRRDAHEKLKIFLKDKKITKDLVRVCKKEIQEYTDLFIKKVNNIVNLKEKELITI
ncbi:ribosome recycling factor [Buchnera aphidicola]|uniref:ribosome recycling factor n=1 Tax=Buchnera aphidicola TaxID=9 RepID=UPI00094D746E|nr:ribosome recycling factor [Buchnera aphidicola]